MLEEAPSQSPMLICVTAHSVTRYIKDACQCEWIWTLLLLHYLYCRLIRCKALHVAVWKIVESTRQVVTVFVSVSVGSVSVTAAVESNCFFKGYFSLISSHICLQKTLRKYIFQGDQGAFFVWPTVLTPNVLILHEMRWHSHFRGWILQMCLYFCWNDVQSQSQLLTILTNWFNQRVKLAAQALLSDCIVPMLLV